MSDRDEETRGRRRSGHPGTGQDGRPIDDLAHEALASPSDLAAVQADEMLLDLLGRSDPSTPLPDDPLARVLAAWRREVDAEPVGELVDTDTALDIVAAARRPARRRHPALVPVAAAAALLVIAFSGTGLAAKSAQPGDPLWGVTKVLYADHARSVEAAQVVRKQLEQASQELKRGRPDAAQGALERAGQEMPAVSEAEDRSQLEIRHEVLMERLADSPGPGGDSGAAKPDNTATEPAKPAQPTSEPPSTPPSAPPEPTTPPDDGSGADGEPGSASPSGHSPDPPAQSGTTMRSDTGATDSAPGQLAPPPGA